MPSSYQVRRVRFITFVAGAAVMGLEIMASRLLAPSYGDTVYVWGNLIAVIMGALAVGYRRGGVAADRYPNFNRLSNLMFAAGVLILLIPVSTPLVLEILGGFNLGNSAGSLVASVVLLFAPTVYLGMVSPYAVKLCADDVVKIGGISGGLSSINTVGSILGTFFTVFVLIPRFGTREIITSLGVMLVVISLIGRNRRYVITVLCIIAVLLIPNTILMGSLRAIGSSPVYSAVSSYSRITVVENEGVGIRTLFLEDLSQSAMYMNGSTTLVYRYTELFNLGFGYNPDITSVLFIGGGGFSSPKQFLADYPWVQVDVVEIDPMVVQVAYRFFEVPTTDPRLTVSVADGRQFLEDAGKYDLIVLDAYSPTYVPFHLMTQEFHDMVRDHLNADGLVVSNLIGSLVGDTSELFWAEVATVSAVFPHVDLYRTRETLDSIVQNMVMVAYKSAEPVTRDIIRINLMDTLGDTKRVTGYLDARIGADPPEASLILRDNYAPVDSLLNPVTLSTYNSQGTQDTGTMLSPYLIVAMWVLALGVLFGASTFLEQNQ
jgi:spermidine synthase